MSRHGTSLYEDLGFPDAEAMFLRAGIVAQIQDAMGGGGLSPLQTAERAHTEVSLSQWLRILNRLGQNVEIVVSPAEGSPAKVAVRSGREQAAA